MGDSTNPTLFRNLCILHLQRLTIELKCPLCLKLLNKPIVFPCNHIFCNDCIAMSEQKKRKCPSCEFECLAQEIRSAPYMESIVRLCQSLEETVNARTYEPSLAGNFAKQTPSSINMCCNSRKQHPSEILQKRIYPTSQLDDSFNSSKGETDAKKLRPAKCEEVERIYECAIITEDVSTMIKKEKQTEGCKIAEGNSKGDSVNCGNGGTNLKKSSPAVCVEVEQSPDCVIIIDDDEDVDTTIKEQPQTEDCKIAAEENSKYPVGERPVLRNLSDKELVHKETMISWSTAKKRKRCAFAANQRVLESDSPSKKGVHGSDSIEERGRNGKCTKHRIVPRSTPSSKTANIKQSVCAFCHSSEQNEGTGQLIGFANKRQIDLTSLSNFPRSKVVIGHEKCVHWSPQVFYKDEIIQNLESEVSRAAKLKCRSCGKKGASLGCYLETCQMNYHVPCAYFIPEIRWDCERFLMLCPSHSSCKFPGEMSKPEECSNGESHPLPYKIRPSEKSDFWTKTPGGKKELVLCGSALSLEDKTQVENFASTYGVNVSTSWNQNITHVIASTDDTGACIRTFEFLMAILSGKWIVKIDWIKACIKENQLFDESDYEIGLDNHGCCDGPKIGRLHCSENGPKLFAGLRFHFSGDFDHDELNELSELVEAAGGIIESKESMMASRAGATPKSRYVVYNCNPPQGNPIGDASFLQHRLRNAVDVAVDIGAGVLRHRWISDSIAGCKLIPLQ